MGKLAYASKVVHPGKIFLHGLFELMKGARKNFHNVRMNVGQDLTSTGGQFFAGMEWCVLNQEIQEGRSSSQCNDRCFWSVWM